VRALQNDGMMESDSTTGLTSRTGSVLSYLGWWVTGLIFWGVERRDRVVLFHAVQSTLTFGALAIVIVVLGFLGLLMLSFAPAGFTFFVSAAAVVWVGSVVLWLLAIWQASQGKRLRIPLAARYADTLSARLELRH
jgi:uncharacterized membrane protein